MTTHSLDSPAFPQVGETSGMSRLDYFAGRAMQGWLATFGGDQPFPHPQYLAGIAVDCFDLAEAMLKESLRRAT